MGPLQTIEFVVPGDPVGKGSWDVFVPTYGNGDPVRKHGRIIANVVDKTKGGEEWDVTAIYAARAALMRAGRTSLRELAIEVTATFVFRRGKGHYRQGASTSHMLATDAPLRPNVRPDVDKILRRALDAMQTAGVYTDDGRVAEAEVVKRFGDADDPSREHGPEDIDGPPRSIITVRFFDNRIGHVAAVEQLALAA